MHATVLALIEKFVERQQVPFEVIKKYRAYLVDPSQRRSHDKDYLRSTQMGVWGDNNEWKYFLHGGGCHVTHIETGEVIGWDASNLNRFDPNWLADWVVWYALQHPEDALVKVVTPLLGADNWATSRQMLPVLEQLHQLGKLNYYPNTTNKYELIGEANK